MIDYRGKVAMTCSQTKAFNILKSAFKSCKSSGIQFAMQEDTLMALNGRNVLSIDEGGTREKENEIDLQEFAHEGIDTGISPYIDCSVTITVKS